MKIEQPDNFFDRPQVIRDAKELYLKERAVYRRLNERDVCSVAGFTVPRLLDHHDELFVIEIEFVTPPFVVDFASSGLDSNPLAKYDQEQMDEQFREWQELFGGNWSRAKAVLYGLRAHGVFLADLNPRNIVCE